MVALLLAALSRSPLRSLWLVLSSPSSDTSEAQWQKEKEGTNKSPGTSPAKSPKHGGTSLLSNGEAPSIPGDGFNPCLVGPLVGFNEEEAGDDDGDLPACSRLSKNLVEVLTDKGALSYYIQYLDACEAASLVRFWLDVECFRSAVLDTPTRVSLTYEQLEGMTPHCKSTKETADKLICPDTPLKPPIQQEESTLEPCSKLFSSHSYESNSGDFKRQVSPPLLSNNSVVYQDTCEPSQSMVPVCDHKADSDIRPATQDLDSRSINLCKCGRYILNSDSDAVISISNCKHILNNISMEMGDQVVSDSASAGSRSEADISRDGPQDGRSSDTSSKSPCQCYDVAQSSVNDAIRIYRTYIGHGATHPIPLSEEVKTRVAATICVQDNQLDPECFTEAQNIIYQIMDKEYINDFLRSEFHCKHQIDVLTSSKVTLFDILYNDTALFYFMEFIEQEGHHSLLEFWLAAVNFRQQLLNKVDNYDPMEAQNDAMILYDKFFSLQATSPLGFNDRVRIEMEHNICREEGPLPDCFQKPVKIVTKVLEKNFLQPFLTSQLYFRYLSELINTIQANPPLLTRHRRTGSECSSEFSISTQNTLLAMEDSAPPRKILRNVDHHELSIDLQQLYDPDSLWRRRHHNSHKHVELGGLSFGRINEMGRFETDFEPEPGKKGGNYDEYGGVTSMAILTHLRSLHHPIVEMDGTGLGSKSRAWSAAALVAFLEIVYNECRSDSLIVLHHIVSSKKETPLYHLQKYQLAMKAKEEVAWQIAEQIVKDITSLTLGGQETSQS
uniref:RGS domain-containing protein n=1 Tax=Timema monikensis TaxID=170555 RepID=A0A7R9EH83_9NEOP|nr:unnamed protein product [Timema monikensis]